MAANSDVQLVFLIIVCSLLGYGCANDETNVTTISPLEQMEQQIGTAAFWHDQ